MRRAFTSKPVVVGLIVTVVSLLAGVALFLTTRGPQGVDLVGFPEGSTDLVSYAGRFPASDDTLLENPLGMDLYDDRIYVAESEAGRVAVFTVEGGRFEDIVVPPAEGRTDVYPLDVAVVDEARIAVIDSASARVLLLPIRGGGGPELTLDADSGLLQPTALAVAGDEILIADGEAHAVLVFSADDGTLLRSIGGDLQPSLTAIGGMWVDGDRLYVTDSNAGRVLVLDLGTGEQASVLPEKYSLPRGITAGPDGTLLVVDTFKGAVTMHGDAGEIMADISSIDDMSAALTSPRDVLWSALAGRLYVSDAEQGVVFVYNVRAAVAEQLP